MTPNRISCVHCAGDAAFADMAAAGQGSTAGTLAVTFPALLAEAATGSGTELTVRTPEEISLAS